MIDKTPAIELFNSATLQWLSELVEWFGIRQSKHGRDEDEGLSFECETTTTDEGRILTRINDGYSVRTSLLTSGSPLPTPQITRIEEKEGCVQMMSGTDTMTICPSSSSRYQTAGSYTVSMRQVPTGSGSTIENSPSDQAGATPMDVVENNASTDTDEPMSIEATVTPRKRRYSERDKHIPELAKKVGDLSLEEELPALFDFEREGTIKPFLRARYGRFSQDRTHFVALICMAGRVFGKDVVGTWTRIRTFSHNEDITDACFSPDNKYLVSISKKDRIAKISEVAGSGLEKAIIQHGVDLIGAHFSLGGTRLVIFGHDKARIWELAGEEWLETAILGHYKLVGSACFSSDETRLVTASVNCAVIWRRTDGEWLGESTLEHPDGLLTDARFSPDGIHLVTSTRQGWTAKIWKFVDGKWLFRNTMENRSAVTTVRFSPDNTHLLIDGDFVKILKLVNGEWHEKETWQGYITIRYTPSIEELATDGDNVSPVDGKMEINVGATVVNARFSSCGTHLAICYTDKIVILGLVGGEWQKISSAIEYPDGGVKDAHFSHDCSQLLVDVKSGDHYDIWRLKIKPKRTK